ncbi:MAG: glycosyltransferase family 4 protein [Pseudoxanthomonas sp.]
MKILALTNLYPNPLQPHRAPFNRHLLRMLGQAHELRVIAPTLWLEEWQALRRGGKPLPPSRRVFNEGLVIDHPRYWYTPRILRSHYGQFFRASVAGCFRRALREFAPDIVFAPWAYPDGWAAVRLAHAAGLPAVVQVHGSDVRLLDQFGARTKGTRQALAEADGVIAVSAELAGRVAALGADAGKVRTIVDGVDRQRFHPGPRGEARQALRLDDGVRHLLFIGNLLPVKGVDVLLQACQQLQARRRDWRLHLVGDGPSRAAYERLAQSLGIADRVDFHGSLPHHELPTWLRAADLFVLPSRSEGIPNVLLEASACATPWIASAVGGIPEIAPLGRSRLLPPEQPQTLAEAIAAMLDAPPPMSAHVPRDRRQAVDDIATFLGETLQRHRLVQACPAAGVRVCLP